LQPRPSRSFLPYNLALKQRREIRWQQRHRLAIQWLQGVRTGKLKPSLRTISIASVPS